MAGCSGLLEDLVNLKEAILFKQNNIKQNGGECTRTEKKGKETFFFSFPPKKSLRLGGWKEKTKEEEKGK
ncbi:MAG: hypothetical protein Q8P67_14920 [archaeon]|nr:hypothetical protein [archaeon]